MPSTSIRVKTLLIVGATLVGLVAGVYLLSRSIIFGGFESIEEEAVQENVQRAEDAVAQEVSGISTTTGDWAFWDDSYDFVSTGDETYVESNLAEDTYVTLGVGMILFADDEKGIVYQGAVDPTTGEPQPIPDETMSAVLQSPALFGHSDETTSTEGLLQTQDGVLLIASRAVLRSDRSGPAAGTLIMARYLDDSQLEELRAVTHLDLALEPAGVSTAEGITVVDSGTIEGSSVLRDIQGDPALHLTVSMPRDIYSQGQTTFWYLIGALAASGLVFAVVVTLLLERTVLSRLTSLTRRVTVIGVSSDTTMRVPEQGNDEIGQLATEVNGMLGSIDELHQSLEERVRERTRELEVANDELRERNRQLLDARAQAATDVLTALPNHRAFQEALRRRIADNSGEAVSLIMLDLDGFKEINDTNGHQAGDRILRSVAQTLATAAAPAEAYRYGGDEFAVIAAGMGLPQAEDLSERLRAVIEADLSSASTSITASLGVASFPRTAGTAEELIYEADAAMYAAKMDGKNRSRRWDPATGLAPTRSAPVGGFAGLRRAPATPEGSHRRR